MWSLAALKFTLSHTLLKSLWIFFFALVVKRTKPHILTFFSPVQALYLVELYDAWNFISSEVDNAQSIGKVAKLVCYTIWAQAIYSQSRMKQNGDFLHKNKSDPKHIPERERSSVVKTKEWSEKETRRGRHAELKERHKRKINWKYKGRTWQENFCEDLKTSVRVVITSGEVLKPIVRIRNKVEQINSIQLLHIQRVQCKIEPRRTQA